MFNFFKKDTNPTPDCSHQWHDAGSVIHFDEFDTCEFHTLAYCPRCKTEQVVSPERMQQLLRITEINKDYEEADQWF